ncbi:MAG: PKD domain-containing protein [Flavobacteriales bacterium]|nr:PKD domain-containing protein [Flavobacteriales bacterium]MBT6173979.1 PKD domain-containing protein [Flavobacteriales bacterium]
MLSNNHISSLIFGFASIFVLTTTFAQHTPQTTYKIATESYQWAQLMYENPKEVEEIRAGYETWRLANPETKNQHSQYYKRWLRQVQWPINKPSDAYLEISTTANVSNSGNWTQQGPWHYDPEVAMYFQVQSPGACHVYTVEQAPSNPDIVYCGTATAGMYRSENKGLNWDLISGDLPVTGVYSIAISPSDADLIFLGSSNGNLYKSNNGGMTWNVCGNQAYQSSSRWYRTVVFYENSILAATNDGLWLSEDLGDSMQLIQAGEFMELEQHPTDPSVLYTVKLQGSETIFMKSIDGGLSFSNSGVGVGWPTIGGGSEQKRTEISVSIAEPDAVYALAAGSTPDGGGLYGYYVSHDAGSTFEMACCGDNPGGPWEAGSNPNILGWGEDGSSDGGQYYYDLALGASPTDPNKQFAAGICVWRTESAGASWDLNAHWVTWAGEFTADRYTHADVHDVKFFTQEDGSVDMWVASDGGLYYSADEGDNIEPRMYGLHGTDFWGWQAGWRESEVMVGGTYHNGTLIRNGDLYAFGNPDNGAASDSSGGWLAELAGDNYRGFVNPGDPTVGYADNGAFGYTEDRFERISGLAFDDSKVPNASYWFGEVGNFEWDPTCYNRFYSPVGSELWRTNNGGVSWELIHDFGGEKIVSVQVSPADKNRIYISHKYSGSSWRIHRSTDGGMTWYNVSLINSESNYNSNKAIYLDTDGTNPDRLFAILLGTQDGYQVFESQNAGDTWQNLTTATLNDEHVISIAHQRGTEGGLYLGTTRAVYYRDDSMTDWELFNSGLPVITPATFLQPDYCGGTIRTAGSRSVHESPFYSPSEVQASFMADRTSLNLATPCDSPPIHFSDVSVVRCEGAQYIWEFEGGVPNSATGPEAYVYYENAGAFDVTLTVINSEGNQDSITWEDLISVTNEGVVEDTGFSEDFDGDAFPPDHWRMETPGHAWEHAYDLQNASNGVAQFPNYWVNTNGAHDMLITPGFNPTYIETVSFDYAHMKYSSYVDGLQVVGKLSGEEEWTVLWERYGDYLSVPGCYTWFWYDTGGSIAWENVLINVPDYWANSDASCAEIAFVNVGGYGNHIWIDNFLVEGTIDCSADLNNDNSITVSDLLLVLSEFGCLISCEDTDVNGDGLTSVSDLLEILSVFGTICN